jgi:hypothetical protein
MASDEGRVSFPIRCPVCGGEVITQYRAADLVGALINGRPIHLYAACHDQSWVAGYIEVQQIRAHLGARWIDSQRRTHPKDTSRSSED